MGTLDQYRIGQIPTIKEPSLQECIEEFIRQYRIQDKFDKSTSDKKYGAFMRMFCSESEPQENNSINQDELKRFVRENGYYTYSQMHDEKVIFTHIYGEERDSIKGPDTKKIYINCDRKNIAILSKLIFSQIKDIVGDELQMKFISEQIIPDEIIRDETSEIKNHQRNDKIVIYAKNESVAQLMAEKINQIRAIHPELFSAKKTLPFLPKKYGMMAITSDKNLFAKTPLGNVIGSTRNDFMSEVLFQSIIVGFERYSRTDPARETRSYGERISQYLDVYTHMNDKYKVIALNTMAETFMQICKENKIDTVYNEHTNEHDNENRYNDGDYR